VELVERPHITLVYFGCEDPDPEEEARQAGVPDADTLEALNESLMAVEKEELRVRLDKILVHPNLIAALVSFPEDVAEPPSARPRALTDGLDEDTVEQLPMHVTLGVKKQSSDSSSTGSANCYSATTMTTKLVFETTNAILRECANLRWDSEKLAEKDIAVVALKKPKEFTGTVQLRMTDEN